MDGVEKRQGHNLPHWRAPDSTYFVTFRLNDSLPREVVEEMRQEYLQPVLSEEQAVRRTLLPEEIRRVKAKQQNRLEKYLDSGRGACHMNDPKCAEIVRDAMLFFDGQRYALGAWAVMPNHGHAVLKPLVDHALEDVVRSWKGFSSRMINAHLGRKGTLWQSEPYDHLIRNGDSFLRLSKYVLDNPVKAGLRDWPWTGIGSLGPTTEELIAWENTS